MSHRPWTSMTFSKQKTQEAELSGRSQYSSRASAPGKLSTADHTIPQTLNLCTVPEATSRESTTPQLYALRAVQSHQNSSPTTPEPRRNLNTNPQAQTTPYPETPSLLHTTLTGYLSFKAPATSLKKISGSVIPH